MDRPRHNLGVNKNGKTIRKNPQHQPNSAANALNAAASRPQTQPQVYNINKSDFRSIVQQLTGSPISEILPRPPQNNQPKPQNTRLQRMRPAPLTQINRPAVPLPAMAPPQSHPQFARPPSPLPPFPQGIQQSIMVHEGQVWSNTVESPVSGYMRYLQSSLGDSRSNGNQMQPSHEHEPYIRGLEQQSYIQGYEHRPYIPVEPQPQPQPQPHPYMMFGSQPRVNMQGPFQPNQYQPPPFLAPSQMPHNLHSPRFNASVPVNPTLSSSSFNQMYGGIPSPRYNGLGQLHSPTSRFFLQPPTSYRNIFSPKSPYPLLPSGVQYPQPLAPNFSFSQIAQQGSLGPGAGPGPSPPQLPPSPGRIFPLSPSRSLPIPSPRRNGF